MRSNATAIALAATLLPLGCGPSGPALVPVTGTLTLNGQPLAEAGLTFAPDPTNPVVTPGVAVSGSDGSFTARHAERDGLAPGKYKVIVTRPMTKDGKPLPEEYKDDPAMAQVMGLMIETIPLSYTNANTTPLGLDLGEDGGRFDFDVKAAKSDKTKP